MAWITPTIAAIGAVGSLAGSAMQAGAAGSTNNTGEQLQFLLNLRAMQNAEDQQAYSRAQTALANTLSRAGQTDQYGSSVQYNPATNTWESRLGKLPEAESTASAHANISRNTTDLRAAQYANDQALRRASQNAPLVDAARHAYESFQPRSSEELSSLLQNAAIEATNRTNRPIIQDTLRSFARTGTAAAPVLSNMLQTNAQSVRDAIIQARLEALTKNADINNANRSNLLGTYTALSANSVPQLQYAGISTVDPNSAIATAAKEAQQRAASTAVYGANTAAQAANAVTSAAQGAGKAVPDTNMGAEKMGALGKSITDLTSSSGPLANALNTYKDYVKSQPSNKMSAADEAQYFG